MMGYFHRRPILGALEDILLYLRHVRNEPTLKKLLVSREEGARTSHEGVIFDKVVVGRNYAFMQLFTAAILVLLVIFIGCIEMDGICLVAGDVSIYEAIKSLHQHLDDDRSGDIDLSESDEFLREELNYTKGLEKRQKAFHHNDDQHISVNELWTIWLSNEVHNWTVEQTVAWLSTSVELGQYADVFYENAINGSMLPRLATNNEQFLTRILGIKNPTHRSKIGIKSMDIVLFGPPKDTGSLTKDVFIVSLIAFIIVLLFKSFKMRRHNDIILKKMDQEIEALQRELMGQEEKKNLETDKKTDSHDGDLADKNATAVQSEQNDDINGFNDSISMYRENCEWDDNYEHPNSYLGSPELDAPMKNELQLWLQLSYERERIHFTSKIEGTKRHLHEARDRCDKLKPSRKNFFGALSFIHGNIEAKGQPIVEAQEAIREIRQMNEEMKLRWTSIEHILDVDIIKNHGISKLELILEPNLQRFSRASSAAVVQQLLKSQSALMFLTMGGFTSGVNGKSEVGRTSPVSTRSLQSTTSDEVKLRRRSHIRTTSLLSDAASSAFESTSIAGFNPGGSARFHRPVPQQSALQQSHTVASGLSNLTTDKEVMMRSSSYESKKATSDCILTSGLVNGGIDCATDGTVSCTYTVGENCKIRLGDSPSASTAVITGVPSMLPEATSCRDSDNEVTPLQRNSSDKVRTRRGFHRFVKSYSQDENGRMKKVEEEMKSVEKYSSEPSLDLKNCEESVVKESSLPPAKKTGSSKSRNIFSKFRVRSNSKKSGNS